MTTCVITIYRFIFVAGTTYYSFLLVVLCRIFNFVAESLFTIETYAREAELMDQYSAGPGEQQKMKAYEDNFMDAVSKTGPFVMLYSLLISIGKLTILN